MNKKVDVLIVGAGRSGTTTLSEHLKNHPQICFSKVKEVHYFTLDDLYSRGEKYYHSFFEQCAERKVRASADTYLFIANRRILERIYSYNPDIKILIMLRKPVERSFSGYLYAINYGYLDEKVSFTEAIQNEEKLLSQNISIIEQNNLCNLYQSRYYEHLIRWYDVFPQQNIKLIFTKDLRDNLQNTLEELAEFLDIEEFEEVREIRANAATSVKSKKIQQLLMNRQSLLRKFIRKAFPEKLKQKIIDKKIADKILSLNKKEVDKRKITQEEFVLAKKMIEDDLKLLEENFDIKFYD